MVRKDVENNIVYVSRGYGVETQYGYEFSMPHFHYTTDNPWRDNLRAPIDVTFKIRHTPEFIKGSLLPLEQGFHLVSSQKLQGIAPGQFGVIYDAQSHLCIGSGEIEV